MDKLFGKRDVEAKNMPGVNKRAAPKKTRNGLDSRTQREHAAEKNKDWHTAQKSPKLTRMAKKAANFDTKEKGLAKRATSPGYQ